MSLPTGEKKSKIQFRRRNKSKGTQLYPEQQAEQRSCPEVVVLKVTLRGAKQQAVWKQAAQVSRDSSFQGTRREGRVQESPQQPDGYFPIWFSISS